ncbi:MAG: glycosyltransferase [Thermoanaerobaculia bacterium]
MDGAPNVYGPALASVEVSIVVPVFNGAESIAETIREVAAFLAARGRASEIVVVDDGSEDATAREAEAAAASAPVPVFVLRHEKNRGKGAAVRTGMLAARGRDRVFLDADLAYPASEIGVVLDRLRTGADVVLASRVHSESRYLMRPTFFRYLYTRHLAGRFFNWLVRVLLLPGISDTQAGLKGFTASAAAAVFSGWTPDGFGFDLAVLARARRLGLVLAEVPVTFLYDREPTTIRFLGDTARMLHDVVEVRVRIGRGGAIAGEEGRDAPAPAASRERRETPGWALLGLLLAVLAAVEVARSRGAPFLVPLGIWLAGMSALLVSARRSDRACAVSRVRWFQDRGEAAVVLGITALGAVLRLAGLADVPSFLHHDAASCGLVGLRLLTGEGDDPFALVQSWYSFPQLGLVPYTFALQLLGTKVLALRLTSAIPGLLAVPVLYYLVRGWFGRLSASVAAALLATNHVAFHFSRCGIWNIHSLLLGLAGFAALAGGWRKRSAFWLSAAGICLGLTLHTYTAGRLFFGLGVLSAAVLALNAGVRAARALTWLAVAVAFSVAPLASSYLRDPGALSVDRALTVNPFSEETREHVTGQVGSASRSAILRYQVTRTLRAFYDTGDSDSNYGTSRPMIGRVTLALFLAGLAFGLARLPDRRFAFLLAWLAFGLVFGGILAINPPSFPRLLAIVPVPFVFAGVVLGLVWRKAKVLGPVLRAAAAVLALGAASVAFVTNVRVYQRFVARTDLAVNEWDVLHALGDLRRARTVYLFTGPYMYGDSPPFVLFREGRRLLTGMTATDVPERLEEPTAFVISPDYQEIGSVLTDRFPGLDRVASTAGGVSQLTIYGTPGVLKSGKGAGG